jgi:hypothetical protein
MKKFREILFFFVQPSNKRIKLLKYNKIVLFDGVYFCLFLFDGVGRLDGWTKNLCWGNEILCFFA